MGYLKQNASKLLLTCMKILRFTYLEMKKDNYLYIAISTFNTRKIPQKDVKVSKNNPHCVYNAVEIW
jgi:hypothetical protein